VILRLYEHFGLEGMLKRLNGMFAMVIVDLRSREVRLVRDQFGIKPLYWARQGKTLFFGSEVKSFQMHPGFVARLDESNVDEYLSFRYCAADRVLIKDVRQLRAGHCLSFSAESGERICQYYSIPDPSPNTSTTHDQALDEFNERLRYSVRSQLISDVNVGCQLSGGIDSSLVTYLARDQSGDRMEGFSIIFRDSELSEEKWMLQAAIAANVNSHRFAFGDDDFVNDIEPATWHLDQPINHPNSLGIYHLAKKARPFVTVLLSGEGADELLGGYSRFYYASIRPKVKPWLPLLMRLPKVGEKFSRHFGAEFSDATDFFIGASMFQRPADLLQIRPEVNIADVLEKRRSLFEEGRGTYLSNCIKYEMQTYMVDLLVRQDKMTMASSIENRVPFLDRDLVSFVRTLPTSLLTGDRPALYTILNTKIILKDLARRIFDAKFVYRPKSGFTLPLFQFYQDRRFVAVMEDRLLPGMKKRGVVKADSIRNWWRNLPKLPRSTDEKLWISIAFELWAERFLDAPKAAAL
jgi:asparagine synthase (glutamine-hydrolysing)